MERKLNFGGSDGFSDLSTSICRKQKRPKKLLSYDSDYVLLSSYFIFEKLNCHQKFIYYHFNNYLFQLSFPQLLDSAALDIF